MSKSGFPENLRERSVIELNGQDQRHTGQRQPTLDPHLCYHRNTGGTQPFAYTVCENLTV